MGRKTKKPNPLGKSFKHQEVLPDNPYSWPPINWYEGYENCDQDGCPRFDWRPPPEDLSTADARDWVDRAIRYYTYLVEVRDTSTWMSRTGGSALNNAYLLVDHCRRRSTKWLPPLTQFYSHRDTWKLSEELIALKKVRDWFDRVLCQEGRESQKSREPRVKINTQELSVTLDRNVYQLTRAQVHYLQILFEDGEFYSDREAKEELEKRLKGEWFPRPDRIRKKLPPAIERLLETNSKGTRMRSEYLE